MAEKKTTLSIVLRTVDNATAKLNAITKRIDALTKPMRDFGKALGELRDKSGLDAVLGGFKGVGSAVSGLMGILSKAVMGGGVIGVAVAGLFKLVDGFDELGDKAEAMGVSVDFLAQMRFAAERSGASVEALDGGLQGFAKSLGQARAGTGRMAAFLSKVSPALLTQLKAAKDNEAAFNLLAGAMAKIEDPAKRAALAQATLGDAALGPLFKKGPAGIKALRDRYAELAPGQAAAAAAAGEVDDAMKDFKATTDGIKAALVQGLAPALKTIVDQLAAWFKDNRGRVGEFAAELGKKLPAAFNALVNAIKSVIGFLAPFFNSTTKIKIALVALAAIIVGPLVASVYTLGVALLTTPVGWIVAGIAAIAAGAYLLIRNWDEVSAFFTDLWETVSGVFTGAGAVIRLMLLPFTGAALLVISAWDHIESFFVGLWDAITGAFTRAWEVIKGIVDKVTGAVDTVTGAIGEAIDFINPFSDDETTDRSLSITNVADQARAALQAGRSSTEAKVTVDFANAPRGTRVSADRQNTATVDLSVGYQMLGMGT